MKSVKPIVVATALVGGTVGVLLWWADPKKTSMCTACPGDRYANTYATNALAHAFMEIAEAYTNGSLSALRERMAAVPPVITNLAHSVCIEVQRPLSAPFGDSFPVVRQVRVNGKVVSLKSNVRDFSDVNEFDDFAERNIETARFLGETELKRGASSGYLVYLDKEVLKSLNKYREKFRSEGKTELAARADEFYRQWCEHVESENGFARNYARFQVKLQMSFGKTKESATAFARSCIAGIVRCGYTPKWLDEEFSAAPAGRKEAERDGL